MQDLEEQFVQMSLTKYRVLMLIMQCLLLGKQVEMDHLTIQT